jgi:hypothetical protein
MTHLKILKLSIVPLILILSSYCFTAYKLTNERFETCKEVSRILLNNYDVLPKERGMREAIFITKPLLYKLSGFKNAKERQIVEDFFKSSEVEAILVREKHCIRFDFRRKNPFLIAWKGYYLVYHTANNTKYGCPTSDPKDCRLLPCKVKEGNNCNGEERIIEVDIIDKNWIFITTKGVIGTPS